MYVYLTFFKKQLVVSIQQSNAQSLDSHQKPNDRCPLSIRKGLMSSHSKILRHITSSLVASANTPHEACSIVPSCSRQSAFSRLDTLPLLLCFSCLVDISPCASPSFLSGFNQKQRPSNLNEIRRCLHEISLLQSI